MGSFNLTTSGSILLKAGANVNSIFQGISGSNFMSGSCLEAEGIVCTATRYDYVTNLGSVSTQVKNILSDTVSSLVAIDLLNYDHSGYTSETESLNMANILDSKITRNLRILTEEVK